MSTSWRGFVVALVFLAAACGEDRSQAPTTPPAAPVASGYSDAVVTQAPTPQGLHVSATGADFVEFSWNALVTAWSYDIQLSSNTAFSSSDPIHSVEAVPWATPSYLVSGLSPGETVFARVRSIQGRTKSPWTTHVTGMAAEPPPPPPFGADPGSLVIYGLVVTGTGIDDYSRIPDALVGVTNLDTLEVEDYFVTSLNGQYRFDSLTGERYRVDAVAVGYERPYARYARSGADYGEIQLDFWLTPDEIVTADLRRFRRSTWDELGFNALDCPEPEDCPEYWTNREGETRPIEPLLDRRLWVLPTTSPNFHIRTHNDQGRSRISPTWERRIRAAIPGIVSDLTGEPYVGLITTGRKDVDERGWITIEASTESENPELWESDDPDRFICGRARIGAIHGRIRLNRDRIGLSASRGKCGLEAIMAHEIGHALGLYHTSSDSNVMTSGSGVGKFSQRERYHAELAYAYGRYTPYFAGPMVATQEIEPQGSPIAICHGPW